MIRFLLILSLASLACYSSAVAENPTQTAESPSRSVTAVATAIVTADEYLNVRTGPAVTYPPTIYLVAGSAIEIVSECTVNGWVKIEYQDRRGWVNADYLSGSICE